MQLTRAVEAAQYKHSAARGRQLAEQVEAALVVPAYDVENYRVRTRAADSCGGSGLPDDVASDDRRSNRSFAEFDGLERRDVIDETCEIRLGAAAQRA